MLTGVGTFMRSQVLDRKYSFVEILRIARTGLWNDNLKSNGRSKNATTTKKLHKEAKSKFKSKVPFMVDGFGD